MKKHLLLLVAPLMLLSACANQENIDKANAFWLQQYFTLMQARGSSAGMPSMIMNQRAAEKNPVLINKRARIPMSQQEAAVKASQPAIIEVSMEDEILPGIAPLQDRQQMTMLLNMLKESNQETLTAFANLPPATRSQLLTVTTQTERRLKREAAQAKNLSQYVQKHQQLLEAQTKRIEKILTASFTKNK